MLADIMPQGFDEKFGLERLNGSNSLPDVSSNRCIRDTLVLASGISFRLCIALRRPDPQVTIDPVVVCPDLAHIQTRTVQAAKVLRCQ